MAAVDRFNARNNMVERQIIARGIRNELVLAAVRKVPRELFVSDRQQHLAYADHPLPIAALQTISQPYIVALMVEALGLKGGEKVLEIGTGSGYQAAILAEIAGDVYTVERIEELTTLAAENLKKTRYSNIHIMHGDGTLGWSEHAPFDAIVVAAGGIDIPEPLKSQLKVGGRLVIPVGSTKENQKLVRIRRVSETEFESDLLAEVSFVPLIGKQGWQDNNENEVYENFK